MGMAEPYKFDELPAELFEEWGTQKELEPHHLFSG